MRKPTPAFVVAVLALIVALGGTADAVVNAAVPLARRALVAENAKKLNGQTAREIAKVPGPASTAAGIISTRTSAFTLAPGAGAEWTVQCNPFEKIMGGGYASSNTDAFNLVDSYPVSDSAWRWVFVNLDSQTATMTLYATCIR